jgi:pyridoxamine 5'-phosphate oxidase
MEPGDFINRLQELIEDARTAIFVTVGPQDKPHVRWMNPVILKDRPGAIYTFSAPDASKITHINHNGNVEWMIQTPNLSKVINVWGIARVLDNPSLKSEVMEHLASRLECFWKSNIRGTDFVIIETVIAHGTYFEPIKGVMQRVDLSF